MCILLNVKKHEKTFALNVDIFRYPTKIFKSLTKKLRNGIMKIQKAIPCRRFAKVSFKK